MGVDFIHQLKRTDPPRVVIVSLASCFGCQLQITNMEEHLTAVLGQIDLSYWQLAVSGAMPDEFDVAIIEGVVNTEEAQKTVEQLREKAAKIIAIGACATTAGIPGMAAVGFDAASEALPTAAGKMVSPVPVSSVIEVDFEVPCCPIDPYEFVDVLSAALYGSNKSLLTSTLCGECKRNETICFYAQEQLCLGLVTRTGCSARCVNRGRPCNGCRGISPDANLESAREIAERSGIPPKDFDKALEMFNQVNPALQADTLSKED